jgi:hypothetical protein
MFLFVLRNSRYALGKKKIKMEGWGLALAHMNFAASSSAPYVQKAHQPITVINPQFRSAKVWTVGIIDFDCKITFTKPGTETNLWATLGRWVVFWKRMDGVRLHEHLCNSMFTK